MRLISLDGYESNKEIRPSNHPVLSREDSKSIVQFKLGECIQKAYPHYIILEEFPISVFGGRTLYLDFFIPEKRMAFECHGRQHYEFVKHYHGNIDGWVNSQNNDMQKKEWCIRNSIKLIAVRDTDVNWDKFQKFLEFN